MPILSEGELHVVDVETDDDKRLIAEYFGSAVQHFLDTGDTSHLDPFRDRQVAGLPFETDPDVIEDWFLATDFDFQEIYEP